MKKSGKIESTFVDEDEMKKIKDTAGYIAYIYPKSLVFGIVIFVSSNLIIIHSMIRAQKEHLKTADVLLCCAIYNYISDKLQLYD